LNFHEFLHTMYTYVLNSVAKISIILVKYFEYYTIILWAAIFSWTRCMFNEVEQLVRLLLTVPCSNAETERSFSALRRLKTYLKNTMNQDRLNHLTVLHVHQDRLDIIDTSVIAREFVSKCEAWQLVFGDYD